MVFIHVGYNVVMTGTTGKAASELDNNQAHTIHSVLGLGTGTVSTSHIVDQFSHLAYKVN